MVSTVTSCHHAQSLSHELDLIDHIESVQDVQRDFKRGPGWHAIDNGVWVAVNAGSNRELQPRDYPKSVIMMHLLTDIRVTVCLRVRSDNSTNKLKYTDPMPQRERAGKDSPDSAYVEVVDNWRQERKEASPFGHDYAWEGCAYFVERPSVHQTT